MSLGMEHGLIFKQLIKHNLSLAPSLSFVFRSNTDLCSALIIPSQKH